MISRLSSRVGAGRIFVVRPKGNNITPTPTPFPTFTITPTETPVPTYTPTPTPTVITYYYYYLIDCNRTHNKIGRSVNPGLGGEIYVNNDGFCYEIIGTDPGLTFDYDLDTMTMVSDCNDVLCVTFTPTPTPTFTITPTPTPTPTLFIPDNDFTYELLPNNDLSYSLIPNNDLVYVLIPNEDLTYTLIPNNDLIHTFIPDNDLLFTLVPNGELSYTLLPDNDLNPIEVLDNDINYKLILNSDLTYTLIPNNDIRFSILRPTPEPTPTPTPYNVQKIVDLNINDNSSYVGSGNSISDLLGGTGAIVENSFTVNVDGCNRSIVLDGSSSYLITSTSLSSFYSTKSNPNDTSIFLWVYLTDNGVILSEQGTAVLNSNWYDSQIELVNGYLKVSVWPLSSVITSPSQISLNTWHYVGFTYGGTTLTAYVDGQSIGTTYISRQNPWSNGAGLHYAVGGACATTLGDGGFSALRFGGLEIWDGEISSNTVLTNYNNTVNNWICPTPTPTPTPTSTPEPCYSGFTISNCGTSHVYNIGSVPWMGYGDNYLQVGPSQDGGGLIAPQSGWYFVDDCGRVRQLLNTPLWFGGGQNSPTPNGNGWLCVANGPFTIADNVTTLTFCESMPTISFATPTPTPTPIDEFFILDQNGNIITNQNNEGIEFQH